MRSAVLAAAMLAAPAALPQSADLPPEPQFEIEDADAADTRVWLSGLAYGLTSYALSLERDRAQRPFCLPSNETVDVPLLVELLNRRATGQKLSAEQAAVAAVQALQQRFPCRR